MLDEAKSDFARLRERAGISIEDFAPRAGFSVSTLYRWERGEALLHKSLEGFIS